MFQNMMQNIEKRNRVEEQKVKKKLKTLVKNLGDEEGGEDGEDDNELKDFAEVTSIESVNGDNLGNSYGIHDLNVEVDLIKKLCSFLPLSCLLNLDLSSAGLSSAMEGVWKNRLEVERKRVLADMEIIQEEMDRFDFNNLDLSHCAHCEGAEEEFFDGHGKTGSYYFSCQRHNMEEEHFKEEFSGLYHRLMKVFFRIRVLQSPRFAQGEQNAKERMFELAIQEDAVKGIYTDFKDLPNKYNESCKRLSWWN